VVSRSFGFAYRLKVASEHGFESILRRADANAEKRGANGCDHHRSTVILEVDFKSRGIGMTIGELAAESGVPASTIRYWERVGVLPKPARTSGQRRYAADAGHRLAVIRLAQACGFGLDATRQLLHGFGSEVPASRRWLTLARKRCAELDEQMGRLRAMRQVVDRVLLCRCADLSECGRIAAAVMDSK
jgi:DNA-binding transcriptional MerR regulator